MRKERGTNGEHEEGEQRSCSQDNSEMRDEHAQAKIMRNNK
jgi:hypothetical protein